MVEIRLGFGTVSRTMIVNGIGKASCIVGVVTMVSVQPADAAGSPAVAAVKSLSCDQITLPNTSSYEQRFGIPPEQWGSNAESALEYKIDSCFSTNMKISSAQNDALQRKRREVFATQLKDGRAPMADLEQNKTAIATKTPEGEYNPSQQELLIGSQLFVEKYCPMMKPNEEVFESVDQSSSNDKLFYPPTMSNDIRSKGEKVLRYFETHTNSGYKIGSPLDIKVKCGQFATMFIGGPGLYDLVR